MHRRSRRVVVVVADIVVGAVARGWWFFRFFRHCVCIKKLSSVSFGVEMEENGETFFSNFPHIISKEKRRILFKRDRIQRDKRRRSPISLCSISLFLFVCVCELVTFSFPT